MVTRINIVVYHFLNESVELESVCECVDIRVRVRMVSRKVDALYTISLLSQRVRCNAGSEQIAQFYMCE